MIAVLVHSGGVTRTADAVDPAWLLPEAREFLWVDIEAAGPAEHDLLANVFKFHELAVEDAVQAVHHPKIEAYDNFLYLILHRIMPTVNEDGFLTEDVDFFLGRNYLVSVHGATSTSLRTEWDICSKYSDVLAEGPISLLHRIVDRLVDRYGPVVDGLEERLERIERTVFERPNANPLKAILALKRDVASLRRVALPQRDAVARLARREFHQIPEALSYRFRDVYDHLVRVSEESMFFQDRVSGLLDAYLSTQSNRLNRVMKVLTVISTIFMPLTVLTSMWGMNVELPDFPLGENSQFWWVFGIMVASSGIMLWLFRRMRWL